MASAGDCSSDTLNYIVCECGINFHDGIEFKEHLLNQHIKNEPGESADGAEDFYVLEISEENERNINNSHQTALPENLSDIIDTKKETSAAVVHKNLVQECYEKYFKTEREDVADECYEIVTIPEFVNWNLSMKSETSHFEEICQEPTVLNYDDLNNDTINLITIQADYDQQMEPCLSFINETACEIVLEDNSNYSNGDKEMKEISLNDEAVVCNDNLPSFPTQHIIAEKNNLKFCQLCSLMYVSERSYKMHYKRVHLKIQNKYKKYIRKPLDKICEVCGKGFASNALLSYHQRTHTGERPFKCTICGKAFSMLLRLQIHIRTHTGERPYKCVQCPKAFPNKAALNRHNRVHTGEKPYPCPECGRAFSQSNSMKWHVRTVHWNEPWPYKKKKKLPQNKV